MADLDPKALATLHELADKLSFKEFVRTILPGAVGADPPPAASGFNLHGSITYTAVWSGSEAREYRIFCDSLTPVGDNEACKVFVDGQLKATLFPGGSADVSGKEIVVQSYAPTTGHYLRL